MRKQRAIDVLLPRTRRDILAAMLVHPQRTWYQSDLARHLGVPSSSLQRELAALGAAGILRRRRDGNRLYFEADPDCPLLPELTGLIVKTVGLRDVLAEALLPLRDRVSVAFVFGSVARAEERSASDVDLMVIGRAGLADLAPLLAKAERRLGRPVNASVYEADELAKKLKAGHHFIKTVFESAKLFVVGSPHDLEAIIGQQPSAGSRDMQKRA